LPLSRRNRHYLRKETTMESVKATTHAVRNVMMNELGITRDFIREQALALIEQEVRKILTSSDLAMSARIDRILRAEVTAQMRSNSNWGQDKLDELVRTVVKEQAKLELGRLFDIKITKRE